jgi:galactofuranose transport system permease protein
MSAASIPARRARGFKLPQKYLPVVATLTLLIVMFTAGALRYEGFGSSQVVLNIFVDNSFLLVVAVGMTFVILTGGIDLSVGAVVALGTVLCGTLIEKQGWSPLIVVPLVLLVGSTLGLAMGCIIHYFEIEPFIVTLAGLFLARGICYAITTDSITITDPTFSKWAQGTVELGGTFLTTGAIVALIVVVIGAYVLHYTRLGRNTYAIGGSAHSAMLMGLPVARTKVAVYTISGFCAALGGILLSFYTLSGFGSLAIGMELEAIAAVVIGGTLLTGGSGYLLGSVLGVLVLGMIQTLISFDGTLSSWWTKIFIATLLLAFILLQRLVFARGKMGGLSRGSAA